MRIIKRAIAAVAALALLSLPLFTTNAAFDLTYWKKLAGVDAIAPTVATYTVGSSSVRIPKIFVTDLDVSGVFTFGGTMGGNLDMNNNLVLNIGVAGTDFTSGGGLNIATDLDVLDTATVGDLVIDEAVGTLNFSGGTSATITSAFGTIGFDNENLSTSGTLGAGVTTVTSLNTTADSNQVVFDSDAGSGITTTLTDSATVAGKVLTLPNATDTLVGKATGDVFTNKTFDANGTGNSISNIDVADLANGTDGELITWNASGVASTVAVGTSTHVLTSNGTGAAPTFQAIPFPAEADTLQSVTTRGAVTTTASEFQNATNAVILGKDIAGGTSNDEGIIKLWSDGDNAYSTLLKAGTNSSDATYILPVDEPAATYLLNMTTGGQIGYDTSVYLTSEADTLQTATTRGATTTTNIASTNATAFTGGEDKTGGTPNTAGQIKLWSSGDDAMYNTFTAGDNSANATYTLPLAMPAASGYTLASSDAGVMSWIAEPAEADTLANVTGRGATTPTASTFEGNLTVGKNSGTTGQMSFVGTTSGTAILKTSDVAGSPTVTLPTTSGTLATLLQTKNLHGMFATGALSFDNTEHQLTIAGGANTYWYQGVKYTTASAIMADIDVCSTLANNTTYGFYFSDATGVLTCQTAGYNFFTQIPVATVFWNGSAGAIQTETHNSTRDLDWHTWAHDSIGTRYQSGLDKTLPTTTTDNQLSITGGNIRDEDINFTVPNPQTTSRILYKASASVYTYVDSALPYAGTDADPKWLNTTAYTLDSVGNSDFVNYWVYASLDTSRPIYIIPTTATSAFNTIGAARLEAVPNLASLNLNPELKLIYKFLYKGDGEFQESVDYRNSSSVPAGGSPSTSAAAVTFSPAGGIVATTVQSAIEELDSEKATIASPTFTGTVSMDMSAFTPSADIPLANDGAITCNKTLMRVVGDGAAVVLDTAPSVNDGTTDGQFCLIEGTSDTNTVQIVDNTNVQLAGGANFTLAKGNILTLVWDSGDSDWYEVSRSAN